MAIKSLPLSHTPDPDAIKCELTISGDNCHWAVDVYVTPEQLAAMQDDGVDLMRVVAEYPASDEVIAANRPGGHTKH